METKVREQIAESQNMNTDAFGAGETLEVRKRVIGHGDQIQWW
jgi:hypothetical protein